MRRHSEAFPYVLVIGTGLLLAAFKSIYEDAAKAWVLKRLEQWGFGPEAAQVTSSFTELVPSIGLAVLVVWALYIYIRQEFERKRIVFARTVPKVAGDFGFYRAGVTVMNTSSTQKLNDCRCEIVELRDEEGYVIERNIGLRTRGQENKEVQGRFNLDQDATKDIPIFDVDQSVQDDNALKIINANGWDLSYEHGIYTAILRCYGDTGLPDELAVRINTFPCSFEIVDKPPPGRERPTDEED